MMQAEPKWQAVHGVPFAHVPNPSTQVKRRNPMSVLLMAVSVLNHQANSISAVWFTDLIRGRIEGSLSPDALQKQDGEDHDYLLMHPVYSEDWVHSIKPQHKVPEKVIRDVSSGGSLKSRCWCATTHTTVNLEFGLRS